MKRGSFSNSVSQLVLNNYYIDETVAWADIVAREMKSASSFLVHEHLVRFIQLFINQKITLPKKPKKIYLSKALAVRYLDVASKTSTVTALSKNPQNTSLSKVPPPLPADYVLPLHHVTALSSGIHRAASVTPFLYLS